MSRAVIIASGQVTDHARARRLFDPDDVVLCADGGYRVAQSLGIRPRALVGDLDSLSEAEQLAVLETGLQIHRHPKDKAQTDLELALTLAATAGHHPLMIVGGLGGRLDHTLGNLGLLASDRFSPYEVSMDDGLVQVLVCRQRVTIYGRRGDLVSLIPWGGEVGGVRTNRLKWGLQGDVLSADRTRAISNVMLDETAEVEVSAGVLLVFHLREGADPPTGGQ
jgi:thiamine pyrophosphokinase